MFTKIGCFTACCFFVAMSCKFIKVFLHIYYCTRTCSFVFFRLRSKLLDFGFQIQIILWKECPCWWTNNSWFRANQNPAGLEGWPIEILGLLASCRLQAWNNCFVESIYRILICFVKIWTSSLMVNNFKITIHNFNWSMTYVNDFYEQKLKITFH